MRKLGWSAVLGSVPVCALYWIGRLSRGSGPPSYFWVDFTMFFLWPGYYFLAAVDSLLHFSRNGQTANIAVMLVFDCVFWSLVVLMAWSSIESLRKPAVKAADPGEDATVHPPNYLSL